MTMPGIDRRTSFRGDNHETINPNVHPSLLQPRVPEERPRHRDIAFELRGARGEAVEISDPDVRHFGEDDLLHVAPQRTALLRVGFGVERRKSSLLGGGAPPPRAP